METSIKPASLMPRPGRSQVRGNRPRQLLAKVTPIAGESLISVVSAAAAANRLEKVRSILELVGARYQHGSLHADRRLLESLSRLLGIDACELSARMYGELAASGTRAFFGHAVPACWLSTAKRIALGHDSDNRHYNSGKSRRLHLALWDVALFDVCPDSGAKLIDHCPRCRSRLTWAASNITACNACGTDLTVLKPEQALSAEELRGVRFIADLLAPWRNASVEARRNLAPALQALTTVELIQLALMLPELTVESQATIPKRYRKWSRRSYSQLASAFDILTGWPQALNNALDAFVDAGTGPGRCGIKGKLGVRFSTMVLDLRHMADGGGTGNASSALLLKHMALYFSLRPDFLLRSDGVLREWMKSAIDTKANADLSFITMNEAKQLVGWSSNLIRRLAEVQPEIVAHSDGRGTGAPFVLRRTELLQLRVAWNDAMSIKELSAKLQISSSSCVEVVNAGLLEVFDPRLATLKAAGRGSRFVSRSSLQEVMQYLQETARDSPSEPLKLSKAALIFRKVGLGWPQMLQAMLDGSVCHYREGRDGTALPFVLDRAELIAFLKPHPVETPLSTVSLARSLGVSQSTVAALARVQVFVPLPNRGPRQAWQFPPDSISVFRASFATTKDVAALLKLPDHSIRNILPAALRRYGAKPIVGRGRVSVDANLVWLLSDVEPLGKLLISEIK